MQQKKCNPLKGLQPWPNLHHCGSNERIWLHQRDGAEEDRDAHRHLQDAVSARATRANWASVTGSPNGPLVVIVKRVRRFKVKRDVLTVKLSKTRSTFCHGRALKVWLVPAWHQLRSPSNNTAPTHTWGFKRGQTANLVMRLSCQISFNLSFIKLARWTQLYSHQISASTAPLASVASNCMEGSPVRML